MEADLALDFEHYTVAWIAPLRIEAQAAWYMLDNEHPGSFAMDRGDDYVYTAGDINGHNVIIATLPKSTDYGTGSAAALASQVKKSFPNLWFGLLVGVAAGLPNLSRRPARDIRLGDVLVGVGEGDSAGIVGYGLGKETSDGFQLLHGGAQAKTELVVSSAIGNIEAYEPMRGNVFLKYYEAMKDKEHKDGTFADPGQEKDNLYQTINVDAVQAVDQLTQTANTESSHLSPLVERPMRQPSKRTQVWYGSIGSGDKLMKNAQKRDELRDQFDLIGLEMEAAGTINTIPVGVIRGVCDYGDAHKNKEWQPYAAAVAAAYAKAVLYKIRPKKNRREEALLARAAQGAQVTPLQNDWPFTVVPYSRNDDFVLRKDILEALDRLLKPYGTYRTAAIWGLGGCGKTQVALEYAYRRQKATSCSIFWVHADSEARFTEDYSEIAKRANLSSDLRGEDLLRAVQQWIEQQMNWLVVFDNVDQLRVFRKTSNREIDNDQSPNPALLRFVPKGRNGAVIWTSRDGAILGKLVSVNQGLEIGAMTTTESSDLFRKLSGANLTNEDTEIEQLLGFLQNLPLAIAQAANYIRKTKVSIKTYLKAFTESETRQSNLLSEEFDDVYRSDVPNSVMLTWIISMKQISQESKCGENILNTVAFLDNQGLPFALIKAAAGPEYNDDQVLAAAGRLMEYSFLQAQRTADEGWPVYEQHRLVQLAARRALQTEHFRLYSGKALQIMYTVFPHSSVETWTACKLYLPHALKAEAWPEANRYIELAPSLLSRMGIYYWEQGRYEEAKELETKWVKLEMEANGEKHPDTILAMSNLAGTLRRGGHLDEAEELLVKVLQLRTDLLGERDLDTVSAMSNLASTWSRQARLKEAEELQAKVLELRKDLLGEKHRDTIITMSNLALTWHKQRRFEEAEQLQVKVLHLEEGLMGEKEPETIKSMLNLALTWKIQGRLEDAEKLLARAEGLSQSVLGNGHPDTVRIMKALASIRQKHLSSDLQN